MKTSPPETILFAVVGMSPAVLTETAWALAREKPATLPRRVVVTTRAGRERLRCDVLDSGVWAELRRALKAGDALQFADTGAHIRVISNAERELDDIRTREDNTAAADFVLENLRAFTENPDLRVVATIAGGRKTMSALLYAAMTLIGRETDRITHVLASEELETRREPPFCFPRAAAEGRRLQLADIPFVPLRNRFQELGRLPGGFSNMVAHYRRALSSGDLQAGRSGLYEVLREFSVHENLRRVHEINREHGRRDGGMETQRNVSMVRHKGYLLNKEPFLDAEIMPHGCDARTGLAAQNTFAPHGCPGTIRQPPLRWPESEPTGDPAALRRKKAVTHTHRGDTINHMPCRTPAFAVVSGNRPRRRSPMRAENSS